MDRYWLRLVYFRPVGIPDNKSISLIVDNVNQKWRTGQANDSTEEAKNRVDSIEWKVSPDRKLDLGVFVKIRVYDK